LVGLKGRRKTETGEEKQVSIPLLVGLKGYEWIGKRSHKFVSIPLLVGLKDENATFGQVLKDRFNSTIGRIKGESNKISVISAPRFQFHYWSD